MPCTTILVGRKASYDGSTMIARNDDSGSGHFTSKKFVLVKPEEQPREYHSVISHVTVKLPDDPMRYTAMPNAEEGEGIWAAAGVNEENISMTATETITSNARVLGADPLVTYEKAEGDRPEKAGGIGEEDLVVLVLPYIHSARDGVKRLGSLLEEYGTYEMNGIAFQDAREIWWLETIGGHHWMAKRVPDEQYVVMPNQLGIEEFDFADAYGEQKNYMCSADLYEFTKENYLALDLAKEDEDRRSFGFSTSAAAQAQDADGKDAGSGSLPKINARLAYGSHDDADHVYNTPRAWIMERYLNPHTCRWDGPDADYTPASDDIPWSRVPERKITVEDVKYLLSNHFQGTPYDPYAKYGDPSMRGAYRSIGVNRTSFLSCVQIRPYVPKEIAALEWVAFGSNVFNAFVPFYTNVTKTPEYLANTTGQATTDNLYWASRILGVMADAHFGFCQNHIEHYQEHTAAKSHEIVTKTDKAFTKMLHAAAGTAADETATAAAAQIDAALASAAGAAGTGAPKNSAVTAFLEKANDELADMLRKETDDALNHVLFEASCHMKNQYSRNDA